MRTHPLLAVADKIDPDGVYTLADLALLTGAALSTVSHWRRGGHLGQARTEDSEALMPGWRWVLDGAVLLAAIHTSAPAQDHSTPAGEANAWRLGCRDDSGTCECRGDHNHSTRQSYRRQADGRFPRPAQREVLRLVRARSSVSAAAAAVGLSEAAVNAYSRRHPEFAEELDAAREHLCRRRGDCGKDAGWRAGCRGLWCLRQHRESTSREPAAPRGRARADHSARAMGYPHADAYLAAHPGVPVRRLAAILGVSITTVRRWRRESPG